MYVAWPFFAFSFLEVCLFSVSRFWITASFMEFFFNFFSQRSEILNLDVLVDSAGQMQVSTHQNMSFEVFSYLRSLFISMLLYWVAKPFKRFGIIWLAWKDLCYLKEDFMAMKGFKLPQKPKKRSKLIQKGINVSLLFKMELEWKSTVWFGWAFP